MRTFSRRTLLKLGLINTTAGALAACTTSEENGRISKAANTASGESPWLKADRIVADIKPVAFPDRDILVESYAPQPSDARPAIMAAMEACHAAGGGRVIIPAGEWLVDGPIHFKSNVNLHLPANALLRFSPNKKSYLPVVFTRWEGTEAYNYSPFIYGRNLKNVAITGPGKIDGQGRQHWLPIRKKQKPDQKKLRDMGRDGVPIEQRVFGDGHYLRPHFIQFIDCERVLIDGPTLLDSPFWCVHPVYCNDVIVRNIKIESMHLNSDGVDPDSCSNVLIENCEFAVGDDGVALKAGRDQDGWRVGKACERIVVRNNRYTGNAGGGMAIGSEMSGGVRQVYVDGYEIPEAHHGLYFKANLDRGGLIEDIHIRNIRGGKVSNFIIFTNEYHSYRGGNYPPRFERISISDASCKQSRIGIHITGDPRAPVKDINFNNVTIQTAELDMQVADAMNVTLKNVFINHNAVSKITLKPRDQFRSFRR